MIGTKQRVYKDEYGNQGMHDYPKDNPVLSNKDASLVYEYTTKTGKGYLDYLLS